MRASVYSAPGWELGPRALNTTEGEGKERRKADWARSRLSWAYPGSSWWGGLQFCFFGICGGLCRLLREFRRGLLDFPLVFSVFSWPTWRRSLLLRRRLATCSYC